MVVSRMIGVQPGLLREPPTPRSAPSAASRFFATLASRFGVCDTPASLPLPCVPDVRRARGPRDTLHCAVLVQLVAALILHVCFVCARNNKRNHNRYESRPTPLSTRSLSAHETDRVWRALTLLLYMPSKPFLPPCARIILSMLNRTVLESGRHCPARISSPGLTRKQGDTWMGVFLWRFSKRPYFLM